MVHTLDVLYCFFSAAGSKDCVTSRKACKCARIETLFTPVIYLCCYVKTGEHVLVKTNQDLPTLDQLSEKSQVQKQIVDH